MGALPVRVKVRVPVTEVVRETVGTEAVSGVTSGVQPRPPGGVDVAEAYAVGAVGAVAGGAVH